MTPPLWQRLASRLLAGRTSPVRRDEILGDLTEDYARRQACHGRTAAWWWLAREIRSLHRAIGAGDGADRRGGGVIDALWQDTRYAVRGYRRTPLFTVVALLTLTLGIGATSAMFGIVHAVVLRPLAYPDADRLARIFQVRRSTGALGAVSPPNFFDLRDEMRATAGIAAFWSPRVTTTDPQGNSQRMLAATCSYTLFGVLGVEPLLGRGFVATDDTPGAGRVTVLSHALWQRMFGGDAGVVGRQMLVDGASTDIVGVMPPGFDFPAAGTELWVPLRLSRTQPPNPAIPASGYRQYRILNVVARPAPGISLDQMNADLVRLAGVLERQYAEANHDMTARAISLHDVVVGAVRPALFILLGAVVCVLLIACANVAGLLLVRGLGRAREVSIRLALGAGRARLVRQLLTESVLLGLAGGLAGLVAGTWGFDALLRFAPADTPRLGNVGLDGATVAFTIAIAVGAGVVFGLAPALQTRAGDLPQALRSGRGALVAGGRRARQALVVVEVALSLMLLIGAGLLVQSFLRIQHVDPGFQPSNVLTVDRIDLPRDAATPQASAQFFERLLTTMQAIPGITAAGLTLGLPLDPKAHFYVDNSTFSIEGQPLRAVADRPSAPLHVVGGDYFATIGVPLLRGRLFDARDRADAPGVMLINDAMARRFWPDGNPVGHRITHDLAIVPGQPVSREIVGVVGDVRHFGLEQPTEPQMFVPHAQMPWPSMAVVVKTAFDADHAGAAVRDAVWSLDHGIPVPPAQPLDRVVADALGEPRFRAWLLGVFAASALVLAMIGLYGTMACTVQLRSREIGLRIALGSTPRQAGGLLVGAGLKLTAIGIALGLCGAAAMTRVLSTLLFGVGTTDAATFIALPALVLVLASVACYLPARRVYRIDPVAAINADR